MPLRKPLLIIDDDADIRDAIQDLLGIKGYDVAKAKDGRTGLAYLRSFPPPGVILLDWNMAPMNGAQFMAELANDAALSAIPVVLLTADARPEEKAGSNGFAGLLVKPVDLDRLLAIVSRYCDA